jgi:hypothetical protein
MAMNADSFETVVVETDLLILGGGMAACGAAFEASYWAKKHQQRVTLVDKAAMERSGAVAMGLSAINLYLGLKNGINTVEDYVNYVKNDLMGIARADLVANIARHVDSSVHLFEKWGLPIWKDMEGNYVNEGRWQIMIHGESYKNIISEAAKNALKELGELGSYYERIFITEPVIFEDRCVGAAGFSVRENKFYLFRARAVIDAMGGRGSYFPPPLSRGRARKVVVPAVQQRGQYLFCTEVGCRDDMPGGPVCSCPLQRCLRPGGSLVPAFQIKSHQRQGGGLHGDPGCGAGKMGTLRNCETHPRKPEELPDAA